MELFNRKRIGMLVSLLFMATPAIPSTGISELWQRIDFTTENGERVLIETRGHAIQHAEISLQGKRIVLPKEALVGLGMPVLRNTELVTSFGIDGTTVSASTVLQFPILDDAKNTELPNEMAVVWFVFRDGKLRRRDIWSDGTQQRLRDSRDFSQP